MKIAVVGATGLVGQTMIRVLEERKFPVETLIPVASPHSFGKKIFFQNRDFPVADHKTAIREKPDIALFSAGGEVSRQWAPKYVEAGITVIDNSSAWRMFPEVPLIVPEVNGTILTPSDRLIANPNCSTIQLVMVLAPIHKAFGIRRIVVSTYQSVTGSGMKAVKQLDQEREGITGEKIYPHPIDLNLFPHGGAFEQNGYTAEEMKLVNETRKILNDPHISISPTIVRVPVKGGHSEAVNIECHQPCDVGRVRDLLCQMPGVVVQDNPGENLYPMPLYAEGKDEVFVGRIRTDPWHPNTLNLFIVADNLRKGAATNAVQIAQLLQFSQLL